MSYVELPLPLVSLFAQVRFNWNAIVNIKYKLFTQPSLDKRGNGTRYSLVQIQTRRSFVYVRRTA